MISTIITSEYISHTRAIAEAESDSRSELLNILLSGYDEADSRASRLLKRAGYLEQRQAYCVAVAQSTNPSEMEFPGRAQRISTALVTAVAATPIRILTGIRNNVVTAILSDSRRQSGWTAPQTKLAERCDRSCSASARGHCRHEHGPTLHIVPSQSAARSDNCAGFCLRQQPGRAVLGLADQKPDAPSGGDYVRSVAPPWITALIDADAKAKNTLVRTLRG